MAMRTAKHRATILLTLDTSGSMAATDVAPTRLAAMEEQAKAFVKKLPKGIQVGLVTFDSNARLLVPPSTDTAPVLDALGSLQVGGGTATADGIRTALAAVAGVPKGTTGKPTPAVIVLMSDGSPTVGIRRRRPGRRGRRRGQRGEEPSVPIDTIAFGTSSGIGHRPGPAGAGPLRPAGHGAHRLGERRPDLHRRDRLPARLDLRPDRPRRRVHDEDP